MTWGYRRAPFGGRTAIAESPSGAKGVAVSDPAQQSQARRRFEVPTVDAIDWCNAGVFTHAPPCCVVHTTTARADVSDRCLAGIRARVRSPCTTRDRCTAGILARASTLCVGGAGASAAATAGIADGDAVGGTATCGPGTAAWLRFEAGRAGECRHDH